MDGTTSALHHESKRVETEVLATHEADQHKQCWDTMNDVPRPSNSLHNNPKWPHTYLNPARHQEQMKMWPRRVSTIQASRSTYHNERLYQDCIRRVRLIVYTSRTQECECAHICTYGTLSGSSGLWIIKQFSWVPGLTQATHTRTHRYLHPRPVTGTLYPCISLSARCSSSKNCSRTLLQCWGINDRLQWHGCIWIQHWFPQIDSEESTDKAIGFSPVLGCRLLHQIWAWLHDGLGIWNDGSLRGWSNWLVYWVSR